MKMRGHSSSFKLTCFSTWNAWKTSFPFFYQCYLYYWRCVGTSTYTYSATLLTFSTQKNVRMYHIFHITLTLLIVQGKNFLSTPYSDYTARADLTGKELLTLNNIHPLTVDFVASFFSSTNQPFTHSIHFISIHSCMCILHTRIRRDSSVGKMKFKMAFLLFISYCALHKFLHTIFVCYTICLESREKEEHQESKAQGKYIHSLW